MQAHSWVWDLVVDRARLTPRALCAVDEAGRELTFGELATRAEETAAALAGLGLGVGDVACWQLPTWLESLVVTAALSRVGAIQVPLLPILRHRELTVTVEQVRPRVVLCPSVWRGTDYEAMWRMLAAELMPDTPPAVVLCDRSLPAAGDRSALPSVDAARPSVGDHRWTFFTSGTTGVPKGARHSDRSITAGPRCFVERTRLTSEDRYPIIFPFTHVGGVGTLFAQLLTGASAVLDEVFDAARTISYLSASDVTIGAGGTPIVQLYLAHQRQAPEKRLFPKLRLCLAGAAPKPPTLHAAAQAELGGGCVSVYGLTEAPFTTISGVDDPDGALATTEGRPIDGTELRTVALDGRRCGPNEEGELRIKGPNVMLGYVDATLDVDAFDEDGFFRTGDLARIDTDGNLTITGRIKEIIIRKGENISALEVEHVLLTHPEIVDVAVIGLPDPSTGERCCAVAVLAAGASLTLTDLGEFARNAGLATQKVPEQLEVVDALPRNAAGKVAKHELRSSIGARDGARDGAGGARG